MVFSDLVLTLDEVGGARPGLLGREQHLRTGNVGQSRRRRFVPRALPLESRRLLATNFQVSWLGQTSSMDLTGPDAGVGPDGYLDDEIQLTTKNAGLVVQSVQISLIGSPNPRWESAPNLDGSSNAELIDVSGTSGRTYNVFFNPFDLSGQNALKSGQGQQLEVNVSYTDNGNGASTDNLIVSVGSSNPAAMTPLSAPGPVSWNGFTASWGGQDAAADGGRVHVAIAGLTRPILGAVLSDQVANGKYPSYWSYGTLAPSSPSSGALALSQSGSTADLAFAPIASEASATLTLRLDFGAPYGQQAAQFLGGACDPGLTVGDIRRDRRKRRPRGTSTPTSCWLTPIPTEQST